MMEICEIGCGYYNDTSRDWRKSSHVTSHVHDSLTSTNVTGT